ncbi:response regulator [Cesiribacter andamanensis]|uniref:Cell cycle response regulator CtrA n=1 Tax=Cesiribacter andamanensis AMV16 TaxID=1279009 RepID=M7N7J7_9BACT|nr:response regulator [Cesiribacter andamanensis]EMR03206.1 Cell cycle response regulator CtrA [Cesiribacter andamanensis AMV16]
MNKKVLIAEDSSVIQNLAKKILQFQNFDITAVKNGKQVLDKMEGERFDVIIMDINMPIMDGMQCAEQIRKRDDEKANTPIIIISGNARNYGQEDFDRVGANAYLQKPLNFDELVEKVHELTR